MLGRRHCVQLFLPQHSPCRGVSKRCAAVPKHRHQNVTGSWGIFDTSCNDALKTINPGYLSGPQPDVGKGCQRQATFFWWAGELVRELSRESDPLGTSHSPAADVPHYSYHSLYSDFLLFLKNKKHFPVSTGIAHTRAVLGSECTSGFNTHLNGALHTCNGQRLQDAQRS